MRFRHMGGSVIKTISLDGRTLKIANTIPNFSEWVRSKLLELEEKRVTPVKQGWEYTCDECGWYAVYPRVRTWLYCKDATDGKCGNFDELSHTGKLVSLE